MSKHLRIWLFVLLGTLLTSTSLFAQGVITMTTAKRVGERISLIIKANGDVTIDGVEESARTDGFKKEYTLTSQTVTIRGDVTLLYCMENLLTSLDVSGCTALTTLDCDNNQLTSLNVSGCTALEKLWCYSNQQTSLNVSGCTALTTLYCFGNQLTSLDVSGCTALTTLYCFGNQLTSLDVSGCTALTTLECGINQLTNLKVSGCTALTKLECSYNQLTSLNVSGCTALTKLECSNNQLTSLDLSSCIALSNITCHTNRINQEGITRLVNSLPDRNGKSSGSIDFTRIGEEELNWGKVSDVAIAKRKNWMLSSIERDYYTYNYEYKGVGDGIIYMTTASNIGGSIELGIEANKEVFIEGVKENYSSSNRRRFTLTSQTITIRGDVTELYCYNNQLSSLDVSGCTSLTTLNCEGNKLTSLNVSGCTALTKLRCGDNWLKSLDVSGCTALS